MKFMYLAKRCRGDLLTSVCYLSTKVREPTIGDLRKLHRLIQYLRHNQKLELKLYCDIGDNNSIKIQTYIDASWSNYPTGESQHGCCISLGKGCIFNKSKKQRLVSKSSTESELIALADLSNETFWLKQFLENLNYNVTIDIYEDNKSTIKLLNNGRSHDHRTKHIANKFFYLSDNLKRKEFKLIYNETSTMLADFLPKSIVGK